MISTFEGDKNSYVSDYQNDLDEQKLNSYHNRILQTQNEVDTGALQEYLRSVLTSKLGRERKFSEKTEITYIINNLLVLLKRMLMIPRNEKSFEKLVSVYISLIKTRENSRYHLTLLEEHLKEVLSLDLRTNKKLYLFLTKVFEVNPYLVYKSLQLKPQFLEWNSEESVKIYEKFIEFAASKKNSSLLIKHINRCIGHENNDRESDNKQGKSLERLKIVLKYFPHAPSPEAIRNVHLFINHLIRELIDQKPKEFEVAVLETIKLFIALPWPGMADLSKNSIILAYLSRWKSGKLDIKIQCLLNDILEYLEIKPHLMQDIKKSIMVKIDNLSISRLDHSENFKFLRILFSKLGRQGIEQLLSYNEFLNIVELSKTFPLLGEVVSLLETAKTLAVYNLSQKIHKELKWKIEEILSYDKQSGASQRPQSALASGHQVTFYSAEDRRLALKALRKFKLDSVQVYALLKHYVLKPHLNTRAFQIKKQIIKACLYVLTRGSDLVDKNKVMREILKIINKDLNLKILTIEWFRDHESCYQKKIFEILKEPEHLHVLFQDYASNHMLLKRFSIKVLCFIYPLNLCEIVPFLKRAYYHIYDRLSADKLVSFEEKKQALSLTREILRHRTEIITDDAGMLCSFLYNDLYKGRNYQEDQKNQLLIELFKTLSDLARKTPKNITQFIRPISDYIVKSLNSKDEDQKVKNFALSTFNEIIRNCNYVIIPYFHFRNLFSILREILKDGNRSLDRQEILRVLGNLGFVGREKFDRIRSLIEESSDPQSINQIFEKVCKDSTYLKNIKSVEEGNIPMASWEGPYLFTQQEISDISVEIDSFKKYIFAKIMKIISGQPARIVNFMIFKVLEAFIPILGKDEEKDYQSIIIPGVLKLSISRGSPSNVFSLISKIIRYQETKDYSEPLMNYLIEITESPDHSRHFELMQLFYIIAKEYPQQAFKGDRLKRIIFYIIERVYQDKTSSEQIKLGLNIIESLADLLDNYVHLFLPQFNKLFLKPEPNVCFAYFELILTLCQKSPSTEYYLPPISESLLELLKSENAKSRDNHDSNSIFIQKIISFTICLIIIFGDRFKSFVINFRQLTKQHHIHHVLYEIAEEYMKRHSTLNYLANVFTEQQITELFRHSQSPNFKMVAAPKEREIASKRMIAFVMQEFNCDKNEIEDQSQEWFNKISLVLFEKSSNDFIHECLPLVKEDKNFANDILPLAFYFFWESLAEDDRKKMVNKLKLILESRVISLRIKQKFIDTIYSMAQWKSPIPLKKQFLCEVSTENLDLAKALFYMESLFENDPEAYGQSLIKMYGDLGEKESALGLLQIVQNLNTKTKIELYQKLKRYHQALKQYDMLEEDSLKPENMIMQITIKKEMSDWESVMKLCTTQSTKNPLYKPNLAPLAIEASINLNKWEDVKKWIPHLEEKHDNLNLWNTMLKIHEKQYSEAENYISQDRQLIYPKICQLFNFSFERSMEGVIRLQQLCELEETTSYFTFSSQTEEGEDERKKKFQCIEYRKRLQSLWNDRIEGSKRNLHAMQELLMTRNLLLSKAEDINNWLDYCYLALRENEPEVSKKTLKILIKELENDKDIKKKFQIETLMIETKFILGEIKDEEAVALIEKNIEERGSKKSDQSLCKLYYKCAIWLSEKQYDFTIDKGKKCISLLKKTVEKIKKYIKGWHLKGLMHLKMDELLEHKKLVLQKKLTEEKQSNEIIREVRQTHIFQALHCFIKSVSCGMKNHGFFLEDCLKIINILFNNSEVNGLIEELNKFYNEIPTEGLIDIIPQIISRLDIYERPQILEILKKLLIRVGEQHPQALVFPLVFLRKGNNDTRRKIAEDISKQIEKVDASRFAQIYGDTERIVSELCKVSLKLNEKFKIIMKKLLEESKKHESRTMARKYLSICHKIIKEPLEELSLSEFGFLQQYRQQLSDIINSLEIYVEHCEYDFFRKAQKIITRVVGDLDASLRNIKKISLEQASPKLCRIKNTPVCIPGSYNPSLENVYIEAFHSELEVIDSKQRPKKLIILGSDNKQHLFLLKGKEDLRLDERIMQLFNLINKMFRDPTDQQNFSIKGYSITPISSETGLIEWIQNCDTIGTLIQNYRKNTLGREKVFLEIDISRQWSKEYSNIPKINKVELYREVEERVSGWDLRNVFWVRSSKSEEWLKSRSCYIKSLAVMSMVGYIIGLGDRHPHNIMIQRNTGKVVHIDFGDCFDVNKMRKQFPQRVPFRLTRMLVKAMQPCGIHGIFRHTCEKILKMLRENKQSIITIIEAFRYDPIIGWKFKVKEQCHPDNEFENNQTEQSYFEEDKEKESIEEKNKINLFGNKLNFEFAQHVLKEVKNKLSGKTGSEINKVLNPELHVQALIAEAMSPENLVEHFEGWSIYW